MALTACTVSGTPLQPGAANDGAARLAAIGWPAIAARNPRFVIFGEDHGTAEGPRFFGEVAADLSAQGHRLLIAVELSASDNAILQDAWHGLPAEFTNRLTVGEWRRRRDGNTSIAMLEMLTQLHAIKNSGAPISVVAFNGARDSEQQLRLQTAGSQSGHELMQAENIIAAANAGQYDYVLVLVGEIHASRTVIDFFGPDHFQPMATHLAQSGPVISLAMQTGNGTAWQCLGTATGVDCSVHPMRGLTYQGEAPRMGLGSLPGMRRAASYDGYYWVGPVTASPPARP